MTIRSRRKWQIGLLFGVVLGLTASVVFAEYIYPNPGGMPASATTSRYRDTTNYIDEAHGGSTTYYSIDEIRAEIHTYNNDPGNPNGGWTLKGAQAAGGYSGNYAFTNYSYEGGYYEGSGTWLCDIHSCYGTTQHYFVVSGSGYTYYTSDDGSHSSSSCWNTPGC